MYGLRLTPTPSASPIEPVLEHDVRLQLRRVGLVTSPPEQLVTLHHRNEAGLGELVGRVRMIISKESLARNRDPTRWG
ncbi:MAG: hypothetical protein O7D29_05675 [Gemmatimonadetes bacterium]|nr:hypothetical protein [Gemmatimonadota bacterium]